MRTVALKGMVVWSESGSSGIDHLVPSNQVGLFKYHDQPSVSVGYLPSRRLAKHSANVLSSNRMSDNASMNLSATPPRPYVTLVMRYLLC
jgi:hypothetical protein